MHRIKPYMVLKPVQFWVLMILLFILGVGLGMLLGKMTN